MIIHFEIVNFIKMKLEKNYEYHLFVVYLAAYFTKLTENIIFCNNFLHKFKNFYLEFTTYFKLTLINTLFFGQNEATHISVKHQIILRG
jgi:hypothetical protein